MKRRLPVLSASQIDLHLSCPRKRFIKNALRIPEAQNPSAMIGDAVHAISDAYLTTGAEPDCNATVTYTDKYTGRPVVKMPGQIFQMGRRFLPQPGQAIAEGKFKMTTPGGYTFMGARDWVRLPEHGLLLGDNKTTSNPIYAKSSDELAADTQNALYSFDLFTNPTSPARQGRLPPPEVVPSRWVYFLTRDPSELNAPKKSWASDDQLRKWQSWVSAGRPQAWAAETSNYFPRIAARVDEIDRIAAEIVAIQESTTDPLKVRGNPHACEDMGGCAFANTEHCRLSKADIYGRGLEHHALAEDRESMTMQEAIANAQALAAKLAAANPSAVVPPPVVAAPPAPPAPPLPAAAHWMPGQPFTGAQPYVLGKPLFVVAAAAENPPPPEVAAAWPNANLPYTAEMNDQIARLLAGPATPPSVAVPVPGMTPPGVPESGRINPPEAPTTAAANPEQLQAAHDAKERGLPPVPTVNVPPPVAAPADPGGEAGDDEALRKRLKAEAITRGAKTAKGEVITPSTRIGVKALQLALDAYWREQGAPPPVAVPPTPTPQVALPPAVVPVTTPRDRLIAALRDMALALEQGAL